MVKQKGINLVLLIACALIVLTLVNIGIVSATCSGTGGTITTVGGNCIHTFLSNGTFSVTGTINATVLVVAGGGGGGQSNSGGGGAGGLIYNYTAISAGNYPVIIGAGGAGGVSGPGTQGQNSSFYSHNSIGGGGGGSYNAQACTIGGSGGGGGVNFGIGCIGTTGQGYAGGNATSAFPYVGGGGGGAGGNGINGSTSSGDGGIGINYSINGSVFCYAGGGGGGGNSGHGIGICGGGRGGETSGGNAGTPGTNGTGGGGGGGGNTGTGPGGNGGSGIVIVSYDSPDISYPQFSSNAVNVTNNTEYWASRSFYFNVSIANTNGTAYLTFNNTNYIANNISNNFYVNITNILPTNYSYYWVAYGNGTSNLINNSSIYDYTVANSSAPTCVLISRTPTKINDSSTGIFNVVINCTDPSGINTTKTGDHYWNFITRTLEESIIPGLPNYWSTRYPNNSLAVIDSHAIIQGYKVLRAEGRNTGRWFENLTIDNETVTGKTFNETILNDTYSYAIDDGGDYGDLNITVEQPTNTSAIFNVTGLIEVAAFRQMFYLDKYNMGAETKKNQSINNNTDVLIKSFDFEATLGSQNYTINTFYNLGYNGADIPTVTLYLYYCNNSYNVSINNSSNNPASSPYCISIDSFLPGDITAYFTYLNSSYTKRTYSVTNRIIGGAITATPEYYLAFKTISTKDYYIKYANGTTVTDVSFNNTNVSWTSTDAGTSWTHAYWTPDIFTTTTKAIGDQFQFGLYVKDTLGYIYSNWTIFTDDITPTNHLISTPQISEYNSTIFINDTNLNETHKGIMNVKIQVATDPDSVGNVTHNLTLRNTDGTYNYTINGSFKSPDDSPIWISFNTSLVPSGKYRMNIFAQSGDWSLDTENRTTDANFTIDNINPNATLLVPLNNSYNNTDQNFTANISDNLGLKNATLYVYNSTGYYANSTFTFTSGTLQQVIGFIIVLTDNTYHWFYTVFDLAENNYTTPNYTFIKNTALPNVSIIFPTNNSWLNYSNVFINYTTSDNIDSCWYSNDTYSYNMTLTNCGNVTNMTNIIIVDDVWTMWRGYLNMTSYSLANAPVNLSTYISYTTGAEIRSSPILANGYVYFGSDDGYFYQLNATDMTLVNRVLTSGDFIGGAAYANGYVYFGGGTGDGYMWQVNATNVSVVYNKFATGQSIQGYPVVHNGYVYFGSWDTKLYKLNATNLALVTSRVLNQGYNTPMIANDGGTDYMYIACSTTAFCKLNLTDLSTVSQFSGVTTVISSSAAYANGYIYVGSDTPFRLFQLNATDLTFVNSYNTTATIHSSPAIANGYVYVGGYDNYFYQLNATNVSILVNRINLGSYVYDSPSVTRDYAFIGSLDGNLYQLNATNVSKIIDSEYIGLSWSNSVPAIVNGYVYMAGSTKMYRFGTYSYNPTTTINNTSSVSWNDGNHNVTIWVKDSAGNINSNVTTFNIDTHYPNITLITPLNDTYSNISSQDFTANLSDNLGIKNATLYIYNQTSLTNQVYTPFAEGVLQYTIILPVVLVDGFYKWFIGIFDWAGNYYEPLITSCSATGGNITMDGDYCVHTFLSNGTFNITSAMNVSVLVVGGGGGGGAGSGGGGAGGLIYNTSYYIDANTIVGIGEGGTAYQAGGGPDTGNGQTGFNTTFGTLIAYGGSGGGGADHDLATGVFGSAGGGGASSTGKRHGTGSTLGQGYDGGWNWGSDSPYAGGGGGGAGHVGWNASSASVAGSGGDGLQYNISGTPTYYAGGGAAGVYIAGTTLGVAGLGGGGSGCTAAYPNCDGVGTNATPNTGGGGGGGQYSPPDPVIGGHGGSGIVIVRYLATHTADNRTLVIYTQVPQINISNETGNLANYSNVSQNWIYLNMSFTDILQYNSTFNLYNWSSNLSNGILAYWDMTNTSNTTIPDIATTKNYNLTIIKSSSNPSEVQGKIGTGQYNFSAAPLGYLNLTGNNTEFRKQTNSSFSIFLWSNTSNTISNPCFVHTGINGWCIGATAGGLFMWAKSQIAILQTCAGNMQDSQWYHLGLVVQADGTVLMYKNGVNCANGTKTFDTSASTGEIQIGSDTNYNTGVIDEVGIWNRTLTPTEVAQLYNNGNGNGLNNFSLISGNSLNNFSLINSTTLTNISSYNWTGLQDGHYAYEGIVTDIAGNTNTSELKIITLDTHHALLSLDYPPNITAAEYYVNSNNVNFNFTVNDTTSGIYNATFYLYNRTVGRVLLNNTTYTYATLSLNNNVKNISIYNLSDGKYAWKTDAYDFANNYADPDENFTVDTTYPLINYTTPTEDNMANKSQTWIYVNVTVNETYEANITFRLYNFLYTLVNNTTYTDNRTYQNFTGLTNGVYYYNVTVFDLANNQNTTETRKITLDTVAPQINQTSPANGGNYPNNSSVYLNWTINDSSTNLTSGLVGYWNFSNISALNTTKDASGQQPDAILVGGFESINGILEKGFSVNSKNCTGMYVTLTSNFTQTTPTTISFWWKGPSGNPSGMRFAGVNNLITSWTGGWNGFNVILGDMGGAYFVPEIVHGAYNTKLTLANSPLLYNQWTHYVFVYNGTVGGTTDYNWKIYKNGVSVSPPELAWGFPQGGVTPSYNTNTFSVGDWLGSACSSSLPNANTGNFSEVGLWNRSLTDGEVVQLYNNGIGITYPFQGSKSGIKNTTLYVYNATNGTLINQTTKQSYELTDIFNTLVGIPITIGNGIYNWFVDVWDFAGNYNVTSNKTFTTGVWTTNLNVNLKDYWAFEDSAGTNIFNSINASGNGTTTGGPIFVPGVVGNSIETNYPSPNVEYWRRPIETITGNWTVGFWANMTSASGIFISDDLATSYIYFNSTTLLSSHMGGDATVPIESAYNTWHYYTIVYNSSSSTTYFYQNGTLVGTGGAMGPLKLDYFSAWAGGTIPFRGRMDEVGIWSRTLSRDEIIELYNVGNGLTYGIPSVLINYTTPTEVNTANKSQTWIYVNVTANLSNEANITFRLYNFTYTLINNTTYTDNRTYENFTGLANGIYWYNVTVIDLANNENTTELRKITLDTYVPLINQTNPPNGNYSPGTNQTFNWTINDINVVPSLASSGIKNTTIYVYNQTSGALVNNTTKQSYELSDIFSTIVSIPMVLTSGMYNWFIDVWDFSGNYNYTANQTLGIENCQVLSTPNSIYTLKANIFNDTITTNCMIITASNVTLDCAGYSINSIQNFSGVYSNQAYTTIKNCNITMGPINGMGINVNTIGIELPMDSDFGIIYNNTARADIGVGIRIDALSTNLTLNTGISKISNGIFITGNEYGYVSTNNIFNSNKGISDSGAAFYLFRTSNNNLTNNTGISNSNVGIKIDYSPSTNLILNNGTSNLSQGINVYNSPNCNLTSNIGTSDISSGIYLSLSSNITVTSNNGTSNLGRGMFLTGCSRSNLTSNKGISNVDIGINIFNSNNNILIGNNGTSNSGTNNYGIYIDGANNTLINNIGISNTSIGIVLYTISNNTITNNIGTSTSNVGIYLYTSLNNKLTSNTGTSSDGTNAMGIYLSSSSNNNLTNNTGISNSNAGIYLLSSLNNTLTNNIGISNTYYATYLGFSNNNILLNHKSEGYLTNSIGIAFRNGNNNTIQDCINISGISGDILYTTSLSINNTFINCTYRNNGTNESVMAGSTLIRKWYYRAYVNSTTGLGISNANVSALNASGVDGFSLLTNGSGWTDITTITEYVNSGGTREYYNNYTINASNSSYEPANHTYNVSAQSEYNNLTDIFTLTGDVTYPRINITYPLSGYNYSLLSTLNYTLIETNPSVCKFYNGTTNTTITCGDNLTSLIPVQGSNTWVIYVNDTIGNSNSSSVTFVYDTIAPQINQTNPANGSYNKNVTLNWTINESISLATGLVNYWNFNEGTGIATADVVGGRNGTFIQGGAGQYVNWSSSTSCKNGNCINFSNGDAGGTNPFINITNATNIFGNFATPFSVSFWINDTNNTFARWITTILSGGVEAPEVAIYHSSIGGGVNPAGFRLINTTNTNDLSIYENASVPAGIWTHYVFIYDGNKNASTVKIYRNNVLATLTIDKNTLTNNATTTHLYFGSANGWYGTTGAMDEIGIWNRVLNSTEVSQLYNGGTGLYYPFQQSSGIKNTTLYVYNATNGTLINQTTKQSYELTDIFNTLIGLPMILTDGIYNWFVDVWDFAGNYNVTTNKTFTIDNVVPIVNFTSGNEANFSNFSRTWVFVNVSVSVSPADISPYDISFTLYNLTSGAIANQTNLTNQSTVNATTYNINYNWTSLNNSHYFYEVNVTDSAGNKNSTGILIITLDTRAPIIGKSYPSNASGGIAYINTNIFPFNFSVNDSTSGVYNTTLRIYNNVTGSLVNNTTKTYSELNLNNNSISIMINLSDGVYLWDIAAYDFANNFVDPNDTFVVDTIYPLINFTTPTEVNASNKSQIWIYANVTIDEINKANLTFRLYNNSYNLINNTTYLYSIPWCYQDYANISTFCGGLSTGNYSISSGYFYTNYTKPIGASIGSIWQVKRGTYDSINITLPQDCFNSMISLRIKAEISLDAKNFTLECYNNTSWNILNTTDNTTACGGSYWSGPPDKTQYLFDGNWSLYGYTDGQDHIGGCTDDAKIYEEAMFWNTSAGNYNEYINWTNLLDGIYYYNVTAFDLANNQNTTETRKITLDTIASQINQTNPANGSYLNDSNVNFNWTINDTHLTSIWNELGSGLISYWKMDETSGTNVIDSKAYANGTLSATGANFTTAGKINGGTILNKTNIGQVNISSDNRWRDLVNGTNNYSMAIWAYPTQNTDMHGFIAIGGYPDVFSFGEVNDGVTKKIWVYSSIGGNPTAWALATGNDCLINYNQWDYYVLTYNGTSPGGYKIYKNGTQCAALTTFGAYSNPFNPTTATNMQLGVGYCYLDYCHYNGTLDEVAIWNRTLTSDEVAQLYNGGTGRTYESATIFTNGSGIKNTTLYVYNQTSGALVNNTTKQSYELTNIFDTLIGLPMILTDGVYNWFVDVWDFANNYNYTSNKTFVVDLTSPEIYFVSPTESNDTNVSRNWVYANVTVNDLNESNITFRICNSLDCALWNSNITYYNYSYSYNTTVFNNSLSIENLTFDGNQNITRYLQVPQNANITSGFINLTGYNSSLSNYTVPGSESDSGLIQGPGYIWDHNYSTAGYNYNAGGDGYWEGELYENFSINNYSSPQINAKYGFENNILGSVPGVRCIYKIDCLNITSGDYINIYTDQQYVPYTGLGITLFYANNVNIPQSCINNSMIKIRNNLSSYRQTGLPLPKPMGYLYLYELNVTNGPSPTNPSLFIGTNKVWNYTGGFNQTNQVNIASSINSYLSTCPYFAGYCYVPFIFHSDSTGILQYSNLNVSDNNALPYLHYVNWTTLPNGKYYYDVKVYDLSGNSNSTEMREITLDTIAPQINQTNPPNNTYNATTNISFNWTINDSTSGIKNTTIYVYNTSGALVNNTTIQSYELTNIFNTLVGLPMILVDGTYHWFVDVWDFAGNYNYTSNKTLTIDTGIPTDIYFVYPTRDNNTYENNSWISANVSLDTFNLANLTYYLYNYSSGALINNTTYSSIGLVFTDTKITPTFSENISSFETGLDGWTNSSNTYRTTEWASNGSFSMKLEAGADEASISKTFNLTGVNYLVFDFNKTAAGQPGCFLVLNGSNTYGISLETGNNQILNLSNHFGYYSVTFVCYTGVDFCGPSTAYVDNIKLVTNKSYNSPYTALVLNPYYYEFTNLTTNITYLNLSYDNDYATTSAFSHWGNNGWTNESWNVTGMNVSDINYRLRLSKVITSVRVYNHTSGSYVNLTDYIDYNEASNSTMSGFVKIFNVSNSDFISGGIMNISVYLYTTPMIFGCSIQYDSPYYYDSDIGSFGIDALVNTSINWTGLSDGKYLYNATAMKFTGGNNSTETRWITLDTTTPLINYSAGTESNNSIINNRNWTYVNVSINETNQKMINFTLYKSGILHSYYNNSSLLSYGLNSYDYNFTNLPDGNYTYNVTVEDQVNRTNSTPTMRIIIDMNAPNATNIVPLNYTNTSSTSINFTISANDSLGLKNATLFAYNATGQYSNATTYYIFSPEGVASQTIGIVLTMVDGTYKWFLKVFDMGGLSTDTQNYSLDIITTPPTVTIIFPADGGLYNNTTQVSYLNYTVTGANQSYCWYDVNGALNYSAMTTPGNNFTVVPQIGSNTYIVYCNNTAGLTGSHTHTFTLDLNPPVITITSPSPAVDYAKTGGDIDLNFSVTDTNLDSCWYWYNGTTTSIACGAAHKSLGLNGTIVNMTNNMMVFYANDTEGNQANKTIYWYYKVFENARYFNTTAWETEAEKIMIDVNGTGNATLDSDLVYDGVDYVTTKTGDDFRANFTYYKLIPAMTVGKRNESKSFYWNFEYTNGSTTYINTNSSSININLTLLYGPCNATYTGIYSNISFKDENNLTLTNITATADQLTWYYWLSNPLVNKSFSFSNASVNPYYAFCFAPNNTTIYTDISILYANTAANYPQRQYVNHSYILNNSTINTTLYLLNTADGKWVQILTQDLSGLALSGVTITVTREIGTPAIPTVVGSGVTDAAGQVLFFLSPSAPHLFQLSRTGCTNQTALITPTLSSYTITMACANNLPVYPGNTSLEQVRYYRYPVPGVISHCGNNLVSIGNTTFVYYVESEYRNISRAMFAIAYSNRTVIALNESLIGTPYCNSSSCYLTLERELKAGDDIKGAYWVDLGQGYILLESDARWRCIQSNVSDSSTITRGFSTLKDLLGSWHTINESGLSCEEYLNNYTGCVQVGCYWANDTNTCYDFNVKNRQEYSRFVLIFLLLAIVLAVIGRITGYDAQNPGVFLIILTVVVAFGTFSNGLIDGYFYYSDLTPWPLLNNIFLFITVGAVSLGYWASVTRRHT